MSTVDLSTTRVIVVEWVAVEDDGFQYRVRGPFSVKEDHPRGECKGSCGESVDAASWPVPRHGHDLGGNHGWSW